MKSCKYCNVLQPEESFEVCRIVAGKIYRRLKCRKCKQAGRAVRRAKTRRWLDEYKKGVACEHCGFADFRALEFHHKKHSEKDFNVADMLRQGSSIQMIRREISKCVVLCSNCHRIEHYEERMESRLATRNLLP
jgi:hypothetical protein